MISGFFDGFTGGSLSSWLELPGSATQVFADERSTHPQEELVASLLNVQPTEQSDALTERS
jgi:hypothetical protein